MHSHGFVMWYVMMECAYLLVLYLAGFSDWLRVILIILEVYRSMEDFCEYQLSGCLLVWLTLLMTTISKFKYFVDILKLRLVSLNHTFHITNILIPFLIIRYVIISTIQFNFHKRTSEVWGFININNFNASALMKFI